MIESGQATEYLTSMIKGFKLEVSDAIDVVSKLTAVDMEAASSAGDIAAALQNVSTTAQLAGVSLDETIAYATTIIETTQRDASSVGMALRTIMSRYGNVKAGAYTKMNLEYSSDTDLENLNDIEKVLGKIGIRIRSTNTEFRSFSDVLEELSDRWINLDNVSKNAIATAMAGVRQREQFLVLMENMDRVEELEQVSATSQGTAEQKYAAYMETIASASNRVQSAWENLAMTLEQSGLVKLFTDISVVLMKYFLPALQALGAAFVQYNAFKVPTLMKEFFSGKGKGLLSGLGSRKFAQYRQDWKASKLEELQKKSAEETTEAANNKLAQSATSTASALDKVTESASQGATAEVQATKEESKNTSATSRDTKEIKEHAQAVAQDTNKQKTGGVPGKEGGKIKDYFKASLSNAPGAILGGALSGFTTGVGTEGSTTAKAVSGVVAGGLTALGGAFAGPIGAMIGSTIGSFVAEPIANAIDKEENDRKKRIEDATKLLDTLKSQESALEAMTAMSKQESLLSNDIKAIRQYVQDIRDSNKEDSTGRRTFEELLNTEAAEAKQQGRESLIERLKAGTAQSVYDNLDLYLANDSTEEARELRKELTLFLKQANVRAQKNAFLGSKEGKTLSSSDKRELLQYEIQEAYLASGISNQGSSELAKKGIKAAYQEVVDAVNKNRAPEDQLLLTSDVQKMIHLLMEEDDSTSVQSLLAGGNYTLSDIVHNTYKLSEEVQNDLLTQAALALGISIDDVKKRVDEFGLLTVGDLNSSVSDLSDALSSLTSYFDELMSTGTLSLNSLNEVISANGDMATSLGEKDFSYLSSVIPQNFAEIGRKSLENWSQGSASGAGIYEKLAGSNDANIQAAFQILEQEGFTEDKSSLNNLYNALKSNKFGQGTEAAAGAEAIWDMYFENYLKASENIDNIVAAEYEKTTQSAQNAIDRSLQRQQNALEEQKSALEDINSQREYENKLIEAKIKLENAQNEKKKVWREGVGWVYEADTSAIADAQKELDELDNEKKVNELQVMIDELQAQRDWMSNLTESKEFEKAQEFMKQWANNADSTMAVLKFWENAVDNPPSFNTTDKEQLEANKLAATTYKDGLKLDSLNQAYTNLLNTQGGKLLLKGGTQAQLGQMDESDIKAFNTAVNDFQTAYDAAVDQKALTNDDAVEFSGLTLEDIKKFNSMQKDTKSVGYITSGIGTVQNISKSGDWSTALTIEEGESDLERLNIVLSLMNGSTNYTMSGHEAGSLTPTTNEANENEDGIRWNTSWRKDLQVLNDDGTWFRPGDAQGESTANIKQKYSKHFLYNQATGKYYYIGANGIVYDAKFTPSHATGTLSAPGGISMVNDDPQYGLEGIITPQGTLTALPSKSGVVPADMTRNVWQLGEVAPNLVKQLVDINGKFNSPLGFGTDESFNVDHLDVHMVAQPGFDMDDFVRQLRAARDLSKHS